MAILSNHRSRSSRALKASASAPDFREAVDRDDAYRPHAKRRRATRAKFVNIATHDSPSSQESTSESSGRGRQKFFGKAVGNATRKALAVMNTNAFSASRLLAKLPTRRGRSRGDPTPMKPLDRRPSGTSMDDADEDEEEEEEEDREQWAGRKRKRGGELESVVLLRDRKKRKDSGSSHEHTRRRRRSDEMDVDASTDVIELDDDDEDEDSQNAGVVENDEYFMLTAPSWRLHRLKRDDLVRLYEAITETASASRRSSTKKTELIHGWTKNELIDALIAAREHVEPATHSGSTRSSSVVRTPTPPTSLKRSKSRTKHVKVATPPRSASTDYAEEGQDEAEEEQEHEPTPVAARKARNGGLSRSTTTLTLNFSPRRTRSGRDISGLGRSQSMNDMSEAEPVATKGGLRRSGSTRVLSGSSQGESTDDIRTRLRNRGSTKSAEPRTSNLLNAAQRRARFYRNAKGKVSNLAEVSEDDELEVEEEEAVDDAEDEDDTPRNTRRGARQSRPSRRMRPVEDTHIEARTGPLTRSASLRSLASLPSPPSLPIKKRLRSSNHIALEEEEEDGDDEEELEEEDEEAEGSAEGSEVEEVAVSEDGAEVDEVDESVDAATDQDEEEEEEEEEDQPSIIEVLDDDDEEEEDEDIVEVDRHGNPIIRDSDESGEEVEASEAEDGDKTETPEDEDEGEEDVEDADYVDLADATVKSLTRMKRDDLVQLCEARELDVSGTKPQLAQALLEWRDSHADDDSSAISRATSGSASSASTARPRTPRNRRKRSNGTRHPIANGVPKTPILLRSEHIHVEQPRTPPVSHGNTPVINVQTATPQPASQEPELDLDLEELGLEEKEIPPEKLTKLEKIGSGGFKDVFVGKYRGKKVALAEIRGQLTEMDIKELTLLRDFDHPNIVRFLGVSVPQNTRETPVVIISELCTNGDLYDYIRNVPPPPIRKVVTIMLDIANGLRYLHERKPSVIHRDCKSSNILITAGVRAKIADFGLAKVKQSTRSMIRSVVGTVNWQAPELWHPHPKYDYKVDVFSCAMVFWEILQWHNPNKKYPWEGMNEHAIYDAVGQKRQRPSTSGLRKQWNPALVELVESMWAHDARERPTMVEVHDELHRILTTL